MFSEDLILSTQVTWTTLMLRLVIFGGLVTISFQYMQKNRENFDYCDNYHFKFY